jgi:hypothetical protein
MNAINTAALFSELRELADDDLGDRLPEKI